MAAVERIDAARSRPHTRKECTQDLPVPDPVRRSLGYKRCDAHLSRRVPSRPTCLTSVDANRSSPQTRLVSPRLRQFHRVALTRPLTDWGADLRQLNGIP